MSIDWSMGGYAPFVWGSYAVATAGFAFLVLRALIDGARWRKAAEDAEVADRASGPGERP